MQENNLTTTWCAHKHCNQMIDYNPRLAYSNKEGVICPTCIKRIINPVRKELGQMPIFISSSAYSKESYGETDE
tara:strand:- start:91 stop:312 length:222 start_codon:yes stop_codon:yes gene_type:complete